MAVTKARGGFGTIIQRGGGETPTEIFTPISEVLDIDGPEQKLMTEDATNMESPNGWVEKISLGVKEAGNVTFQMHFLPDDTTHALLRSDLNLGTKRNFRIVVAGATKRWEFAGFVETIGASHPVKGKMVRPVSIVITGEPVLVANT